MLFPDNPLIFTPTFSDIPAELCQGCSLLSDIVLPSTVLSVGASAFEGCVSASSLSIDRSLKSIGDRGFYGCTGLGSITCMTATPPACTDSAFGLVNPNIPVTVPMANVNQYAAAPGWNRFTNYTGVY